MPRRAEVTKSSVVRRSTGVREPAARDRSRRLPDYSKITMRSGRRCVLLLSRCLGLPIPLKRTIAASISSSQWRQRNSRSGARGDLSLSEREGAGLGAAGCARQG